VSEANTPEGAASPAPSPGRGGRIALAAAAAIALAAGGVAVWRSRQADAPAPAAAAAGQQPSVDEVIAGLEARLKANPDDAEGWRMLGWSYFQTERYAEAATALKQATRLDPDNPEYYSMLGEALVLASKDGEGIPADAKAAFDKALALDPKDSRARYFHAVALDLAGNHRAALDEWFALLADSPADAPWVADVREVIAAVGRASRGEDPAALEWLRHRRPRYRQRRHPRPVTAGDPGRQPAAAGPAGRDGPRHGRRARGQVEGRPEQRPGLDHADAQPNAARRAKEGPACALGGAQGLPQRRRDQPPAARGRGDVGGAGRLGGCYISAATPWNRGVYRKLTFSLQNSRG
jgi:cytochrome c-type biogenesis protein CcmH/NrfG